MIKITETEVTGWRAAIRGMRNPMNSWAKSDTLYGSAEIIGDELIYYDVKIGEDDHRLMMSLANAGDDHGKLLRYIVVTADIEAPDYWFKEFSTYKVGTVENSTSTMHKIHAKEFTYDDFSHEHCGFDADGVLYQIILALNEYRKKFVDTGDKKYWYQMIQLLPMSYNYKRTVQLNYQVLRHMYKARKNHKLDEWHEFCVWVEDLPYSELITGGSHA